MLAALLYLAVTERGLFRGGRFSTWPVRFLYR